MSTLPLKEIKIAIDSVDAQLLYLQNLTFEHGISLSKPDLELFGRYIRIIIEESQKINIVSKNDLFRLAERHIFESLLLMKSAEFKNGSQVLDIGSGAGFPAIPIKIQKNSLTVHMFESITKKCLFLEKAVGSLSLNNVFIHNGRAEEFGNSAEFEGKFDFVTARAVGPLKKILPVARPFLKTGSGICIFPKGSGLQDELKEADLSGWQISARNYTRYISQDENKDKHLYVVIAVLSDV